MVYDVMIARISMCCNRTNQIFGRPIALEIFFEYALYKFTLYLLTYLLKFREIVYFTVQ